MFRFFFLGASALYAYFKVGKPLYMNSQINENNYYQKEAQAEELQQIPNPTPAQVKHLNDLTQSLMWARYGVTDEIDIKGVISTICALYPMGANVKLLYDFLLEICAVETALGRAAYNINRGYGYGLWQFDEIAFIDTKDRILRKHSTDFLLICNRDIKNVQYGDLRNSSLLACFFARTYIYYRIPHAIPNTRYERAKDWKTYYNTSKGAGTPEKYMNAAVKWIGKE